MTDTDIAPTIVSITPKALRVDSRTLKQALSFQRLGYRSVVYEGIPSGDGFEDLQIEVRSLFRGSPVSLSPPKGPGTAASVDTPPPDSPPTVFQRLKAKYGNAGVWRSLRWIAMRIQESPIGKLLEGITLIRISAMILGQSFGRGRAAIERADLYVLHSFENSLRVLLLAGLRRRPVIFDAHDFYGETDDDLSKASLASDRWWGRQIHWMLHLCFARAAGVMTVSQGLADAFAAKYGRRPLVVRNCHDSRPDDSRAKGLRVRLELSDDIFLVVVLGDNKPGQSILTAFDALADLPATVHLALVGHGYEGFRTVLEDRGIGDRVHLSGPVPSRAVVPTITGADASMILYHPLTTDYRYSLPNRFFQSVAAGLPILYPRLPEIERLADAHGLGVAVDPEDTRSIAAAVRRLLSDPTLRAEIRENVHKAAPLLSWQEEEKVLAGIIKDVLGDRALSPDGTGRSGDFASEEPPCAE